LHRKEKNFKIETINRAKERTVVDTYNRRGSVLAKPHQAFKQTFWIT
jgi:hypothetical protein